MLIANRAATASAKIAITVRGSLTRTDARRFWIGTGTLGDPVSGRSVTVTLDFDHRSRHAVWRWGIALFADRGKSLGNGKHLVPRAHGGRRRGDPFSWNARLWAAQCGFGGRRQLGHPTQHGRARPTDEGQSAGRRRHAAARRPWQHQSRQPGTYRLGRR